MTQKNRAEQEAQNKERVAAEAGDDSPVVDGPTDDEREVSRLEELLAEIREENRKLTEQKQASEAEASRASRNVEPTSSGNIQPDDLPAEPILVAGREEEVVSEGGRNPFALIPRVTITSKTEKVR